MGKFYVVPFVAVAITAAQDLFELKAHATKPFILHEVKWGQYSDAGDAAAESLPFIVKRATGSYTSGSGGTTPTPAPLNPGDTAGFTAEVNNTTQAVAGSGALTTLLPDAAHIANGYHDLPTPERRITCAAAEAIIVSSGAPADSLTCNGYAIVEEIG